jgi:hypothetical protein
MHARERNTTRHADDSLTDAVANGEGGDTRMRRKRSDERQGSAANTTGLPMLQPILCRTLTK